MNLRRLQRDLWLAQRAVGDVDAAQRGPDVLAKRLVRRAWHRRVLRALGPVWRLPR